VSAIPTLAFVKDGKVVDLLVGVQSKAAIKARLDAVLA
jgi:thioredoxin-like negative regulator of GroEL